MGGANTIALFIAAAILNSFRRTVDRLEKADTGLEKRVTNLEIQTTRLAAMGEARDADIKKILEKLDQIWAEVRTKFDAYDANIVEFYKTYDLKEKKAP